MTYAAVIVHVQSVEEARPRLDCAVRIAGLFDATLIGVGAEMIPPLVPDYGFYSVQGDWYEVMRDSIEGNLVRAREAFDKASSGLAKPTTWESGLQLPTPALANASRGADLIVAGTTPGWHESGYRDAAIGELVITSGRPVLIAAGKAPLTGDRVILAWKDTREARRAMSDAMPFFARAKEVLVMEFCAEDDIEDATRRTEDVAVALRRHKVTATAKAVHAQGDGSELCRQADAHGADLIVAGGYGHSRFGEWVFGGVTRDLLGQHSHYVLLSH